MLERIMAVDDNPKSLESIRLALDRQYDVLCFSTGKEALDYLRKPNMVSLILLDVYMKGMDGMNVLSELRKINKEVAVIIMTAFGTKELIIQALQNHADDFLEKPFDLYDLQLKIKSLLHGRRSTEASKNDCIENIKYFVRKNYVNVNLNSLAEEICLSKKYISRLFRDKYKMSFRDFKIQVRIDKAKNFLENTSYPVSYIAEKLGYQNAESFMRIFKRKTKFTPSQYREIARQA